MKTFFSVLHQNVVCFHAHNLIICLLYVNSDVGACDAHNHEVASALKNMLKFFTGRLAVEM